MVTLIIHVTLNYPLHTTCYTVLNSTNRAITF